MSLLSTFLRSKTPDELRDLVKGALPELADDQLRALVDIIAEEVRRRWPFQSSRSRV